MRPLERQRDDALTQLRRQVVRPCWTMGCKRCATPAQTDQGHRQARPVADQVRQQVLEQLDLFMPAGQRGCRRRAQGAAGHPASRACHVNLAVDNAGLQTAPVLIEDNPQLRSLFGSIEVQAEDDAVQADFTGIHAGSLLKARMAVFCRCTCATCWATKARERLRRFRAAAACRSRSWAAATASRPAPRCSPRRWTVEVKISWSARSRSTTPHRRATPRWPGAFAPRWTLPSPLRQPANLPASAVFVAHSCGKRGLPHFGPPMPWPACWSKAHREADDQTRQSAQFALHRGPGHRGRRPVPRAAVPAWWPCPTWKPPCRPAPCATTTPEQRLHREPSPTASLCHAARLAGGPDQRAHADRPGRLPLRLSGASPHAPLPGKGLLNIEREVEMSGPIHDKGVLILHSYLNALFGTHAAGAQCPVVFEQEYSGGRATRPVRRAVCVAVLAPACWRRALR